jgi:hypothetical protein
VLSLLGVLVCRADAAPADRYGDDDRATDETDVLDLDDDGARSRRHRLDEPWSEVGTCECDEGTFARLVARAPGVREVVAAAQRAAGLADDDSTSWRRRSKLAALVPHVSARVGNTQSWRDVVDPTVNRAAAFAVSASWHLDRLVFDPLEMRIARYDVARRRERRAVAALASRAYFAWLRAEASAWPAAAEGGRGPAKGAMRAAEAAAELDALTDGWFSETVAKLLDSR